MSETSITGSAPTDQLGVTAVQLNLGSLQNNGGTTETILPGCSSVAIDKGTPLDASAAQNRAITDSRRDVGAAEYLNPTTVNFTGSPLFGCAPLTTNFVDASSGSVAIASWAWDFGDGNTNSVKNPTHVYQTPGIYSISLAVTDVNGCRTKFTRTNYLQAIGPDVDFGALQTTACLGSPINFKDSTIFGAPIISWTWNFGDGSSGSSLQNPTHTYSQSGTYTVSLKVTDIDGCFRTFTRTNFITISGTTKIVQNTNDSGPGSLRQVITDACSGDTIRFNPNLIASGSDTILLASQISFNKNLVFKGLYNSTDTLVVSGNNATRIFNVNLNSSSNKTLVMDSMVLVNGNTSGNGGAIKFSNGDSLIINNSTISHNSSSGHGGGIFSFSSSSYSLVKLTNSTILGNSSSDHGGGVYSATISSASSSFSPSNSLVKVINSTVTGNLASRDGGGVYSASTSSSSSSFVEVTNSTISDNSASRDGGGVYSAAYERSSSLVEVTNSTITNNSASDNGGGVCSLTSRFSTSFVIVINSTISDNSASLNGGGVYSFA
ncbi:MAG: PKD domain-containing protein, partial [Flavobacteriales bacterium]